MQLKRWVTRLSCEVVSQATQEQQDSCLDLPLVQLLRASVWALGRGREQTGVKNGIPEPVGAGLGQMGDRQVVPLDGVIIV